MCRQLFPPQSLALVIRTPSVPYGLGNVKRPRCGRNDAICAEFIAGRVADDVAESMKPPVWANVSVATSTKPATTNGVIQRGVPKGTKSLQTVRQTGIDTALAAKIHVVVGEKPVLPAIGVCVIATLVRATNLPLRSCF